MSDLKTQKTKQSVGKFLDCIADPGRREDCRALVKILADVTKEEPAMWGSSIVGFGSYH